MHTGESNLHDTPICDVQTSCKLCTLRNKKWLRLYVLPASPWYVPLEPRYHTLSSMSRDVLVLFFLILFFFFNFILLNNHNQQQNNIEYYFFLKIKKTMNIFDTNICYKIASFRADVRTHLIANFWNSIRTLFENLFYLLGCRVCKEFCVQDVWTLRNGPPQTSRRIAPWTSAYESRLEERFLKEKNIKLKICFFLRNGILSISLLVWFHFLSPDVNLCFGLF